MTITPQDLTDDRRTYGNWRRPGGGGLFGLSMRATIVGVMIAAASTMLMAFAGPIPGFGVLFLGLIAVAVGSLRLQHGRTLLQTVAPGVGYASARAAGQTRRRGGPLSRTPGGRFTLPGLAATTTLSEGVDLQGRPFAIVTLPKRHHHTIVLTADPDGAALVDDDDIDQWVAGWAAWLAMLSDEPGLIAVSVTVETSPDSGERLRRELAATTMDDPSPVAAEMLREIAETYTTGSASIRVLIALTFRGTRGQYPEDLSREMSGRAAHFAQRLHGTGAGAARPLSARELCEAIRTAYDPASASTFDDARARGEVVELDWADVGPVAADESYGSYAHDSGVSITWAMTQAPRGGVPAEILTRLLRPDSMLTRKRVTLLYRPIDRGKAARLVVADHRDADGTVRNASRPTFRMLVEQRSAEETAREEAQGASLLNFGMLITATVSSPDRLESARRVMSQLAPTARIEVRPVYGGQEAAFAACLPLGIVLPAHQRSTRIREGL
jgi:hypothetical protein